MYTYLYIYLYTYIYIYIYVCISELDEGFQPYHLPFRRPGPRSANMASSNMASCVCVYIYIYINK